MTDRGVLAVQLPLFFDMPLGVLIEEVSHNERFKLKTAGVRELFTIHSAGVYYDQLTPQFKRVYMWQAEYVHLMDSAELILAMICSTGLKPYLDRLANEAERKAFENRVPDGIRHKYPVQQNGKVLFPFKRLFFVAAVKE